MLGKGFTKYEFRFSKKKYRFQRNLKMLFYVVLLLFSRLTQPTTTTTTTVHYMVSIDLVRKSCPLATKSPMLLKWTRIRFYFESDFCCLFSQKEIKQSPPHHRQQQLSSVSIHYQYQRQLNGASNITTNPLTNPLNKAT